MANPSYDPTKQVRTAAGSARTTPGVGGTASSPGGSQPRTGNTVGQNYSDPTYQAQDNKLKANQTTPGWMTRRETQRQTRYQHQQRKTEQDSYAQKRRAQRRGKFSNVPGEGVVQVGQIGPPTNDVGGGVVSDPPKQGPGQWAYRPGGGRVWIGGGEGPTYGGNNGQLPPGMSGPSGAPNYQDPQGQGTQDQYQDIRKQHEQGVIDAQTQNPAGGTSPYQNPIKQRLSKFMQSRSKYRKSGNTYWDQFAAGR